MIPPRIYEVEAAVTGWMREANCDGIDPDLFFPHRGQSSDEAKAICSRCVVKAECLEYALTNNERFGVWGGTSERERRRIRKARRLAALRAIPEDAA